MPKNIVVCCDGTSNQFGRNNTNVVKLYERVEADEEQLNFYDPGVGTTSRAPLLPFRALNNVLSQGLGLDLQRNVEDAYLFLMNAYEEGDRIFLFGFSRGAHTVRRLADVLGRCGLLYRGSDNMVPYVLRMYDSDEKRALLAEFRKTYTRACPVHFLGVWDTVSALSRMIPRSKLDGVLSREVRYVYHAVSIDEKRLQFPPNLFHGESAGPDQKVEEVWFSGAHSDVGGFYEESGLSDIALKWMLENAKAAGLRVYPDALEGIRPDPLGRHHESWKWFFWFVPWHVYAALFLAALLALQLVISYLGLFWPLPFRPFNYALDVLGENWILGSTVFLAAVFLTQKRRVIPKGAKIHRSVQERMAKGKYRPRNLVGLVERGEIGWVGADSRQA